MPKVLDFLDVIPGSCLLHGSFVAMKDLPQHGGVWHTFCALH